MQVLQVIAGSLGVSGDEMEETDDDPADENVPTSDINEEELIAAKNEFERDFIERHRPLFPENLSPERYLNTKPMKILLRDIQSKWDSCLYRYKPRPVPLGIRDKAKKLLEVLESQGIIRH